MPDTTDVTPYLCRVPRSLAQVRAEMRDRLADARTLLAEDATRLRNWIEALDAEIARGWCPAVTEMLRLAAAFDAPAEF